MKKLWVLALVGTLLAGGAVEGQILKPVTWSYGAKKTGPNEATLFFKATIDDGWHVYSQHVKEGGPIATKFTFAGRTGRQEKAITVATTENPAQPTILKLHVYIEDMVKIEPEIVLWRVGEQPDSKSIRIVIADDSSAKIVSVISDNPALKVRLTETKPGKEYEAQITPESAARPAAATLMIRTDYPPDNPETKYAYARIK